MTLGIVVGEAQSSAPHPTPANPQQFVLPLKQVNLQDIAQVGGKNASLGEMCDNRYRLSLFCAQCPTGSPPPIAI
jgi:hypothetical protein